MSWFTEKMNLEGKELKTETLNLIEAHITQHLEDYSNLLIHTKSPIEEKFGASLYKTLQRSIFHKYDICELQPQTTIRTANKDIHYVADFLLRVAHAETRRSVNVVIECDGHEFHEKTKEQVQKRYMRDRHLMLMGYTVIHYSGSEINKNAPSCSWDVVNIIQNKMEDRSFIETEYPGDEW